MPFVYREECLGCLRRRRRRRPVSRTSGCSFNGCRRSTSKRGILNAKRICPATTGAARDDQDIKASQQRLQLLMKTHRCSTPRHVQRHARAVKRARFETSKIEMMWTWTCVFTWNPLLWQWQHHVGLVAVSSIVTTQFLIKHELNAGITPRH
jgi:hypothetical protein